MAFQPPTSPEGINKVHLLRRKRKDPTLQQLEESVGLRSPVSDLNRAIKSRRRPYEPPVSTLIWSGIALLGNGLPAWGRVFLIVAGVAHWFLKRKAQWQYLYPEDIPDGESLLHLGFFISGWGVVGFFFAKKMGWF